MRITIRGGGVLLENGTSVDSVCLENVETVQQNNEIEWR